MHARQYCRRALEFSPANLDWTGRTTPVAGRVRRDGKAACPGVVFAAWPVGRRLTGSHIYQRAGPSGLGLRIYATVRRRGFLISTVGARKVAICCRAITTKLAELPDDIAAGAVWRVR